MNTITPSSETRTKFMKKVHITSGCWTWTGNINLDGYGRFHAEGTRWYTHRLAYTLANGPIPSGMEVDHMCHNRACLRPEHLQLTTRKQNAENQSGAHKGNVSGIRGVTMGRDRKRWRVQVTHNGRTLKFGSYEDLAEAERAAVAARKALFTNNLLDLAST